MAAGDQPPQPPAAPHHGVLKSSALIALRNLHHLLHLAALCFLLSYLLIITSTSLLKLLCDISLFTSFIGLVSITYLLTLSETNWSLGMPYNNIVKPTDPADPPHAAWGLGRQVFARLCFVVYSIANVLSLLQGTDQAYLQVWKVEVICGNFGILTLVGTIGGVMYTAQRLARMSDHSNEAAAAAAERDERKMMMKPALLKGECNSRESRSSAMARACRSIHCIVKASRWVSVVAFFLTSIWWAFFIDDDGGAERHGACFSGSALSITGALVVGASVMGFPAVLYGGVVSTKAALDISMRKASLHNFDGDSAHSTSYHTFDGVP